MKHDSTAATEMGRHPISVVAARTGLSPDVLRVWERRYDAVTPTRAADGQRLYSDADIARLRALRLATAAGRSIGQIVRLSDAELASLVAEDEAQRGARPTPDREAQAAVDEAVERTEALDAAGLDAVLRRAVARFGVPHALEHVIVPVLHRVGDEWHAGRLSPAQEHLASSSVQFLLTGMMRELARTADATTIVVATPSGERHATGAALVGAWAAAEGWNVIYLGADLPAEDIAASAVAANAQLVALSLVYIEDRKQALEQIRALRAALPDAIDIIIGGAGAALLTTQIAKLGVKTASRLADVAVHSAR